MLRVGVEQEGQVNQSRGKIDRTGVEYELGIVYRVSVPTWIPLNN